MSQTPQLGSAKGNEAARILSMAKQREKEQQQMEETRKKIQEANKVSVSSFGSKFGKSSGDIVSDELGKKTIGLVTLEELKKTKEELAKKERILADLQRQEELETEEKETLEKRQKRKSKLSKSNLSFGDDLEEGAGEGEPETKKKIIKNPTVNTSFLPDRERELQEIEERKKLTETWHQEQDLKKQEVSKFFLKCFLGPEFVD